MRQLVHEAFDIKRVVIAVDAAPEARGDRRVAHGMVDQQVRHLVTEDALRTAGIEALEGERVLAVLQQPGQQRCQDRLTGNAHMQPDELVLGVERAAHPALRDRVIGIVRGVLFARPQQLDGNARHLLGDRDRLIDVVGLAFTAEAAAEKRLDDIALRHRQAGGFRRRRHRAFRVLRRAPDLATIRRIERGGVDRPHGGVDAVRERIDRFDDFHRTVQGCMDIA